MAAMAWDTIRQCRKPTGWLGRWIVQTMNRSHSGLTSWGLERVKINRSDAVLDVGCGGGLTVQKLARVADLGKVHGVDYSKASVAASRDFNRAGIESGRVVIQSATVSRLPFPNDLFDLVTAVETHYYWPDLPGDLREILRVLKPGGSLSIIAEAYRSPRSGLLNQHMMKPLGGAVLSPEDHRDLFAKAGYSDVQVFLEPGRGWIHASGRKPLPF
jgi:SAM-dependent methyltransferase